ncbi:3-oxoacyl-ACP reductase [Microtetraspora sp. NBRC 13810]|uniref:SDR family NAD(P)-dependent oxidoreductase n=1 Tax=Microtetraspora sp. NBRC 13810 TaxID=3030990 RepID=UPI0024A27B63|nr:SDR family oxidoreductase [Microtetraspora sp. NBRC 13810]GLW09809.1 3-oxoacyl-ACP reductase [Microtetraspora sp. NBRC 13810]
MNNTNTLLSGKNAIIYGAGGRIGGAIARAFAREGAALFLAGRTRRTLEETAGVVEAEGGTAHVTVLDALDEQAVGDHVRQVAEQAGGVDVSINLVTRGDVQGVPLLDMAVDDFMAPIGTGARANFITARAAARRMTAQGSGVIMMLTSGSGAVPKPSPDFRMGGTGPADAAVESFMRYLAAEAGPRGVRVLGLWTAGIPYPEMMAPLSLLGRGPTLDQIADAAAFLASDRASGTTATIFNASSGVCA